MGSSYSQQEIAAISQQWYENTVQQPCLVADVALDESFLKYSGLNSSTELQDYAEDLLHSTPDYLEKLGSSLSSFDSVPNAVGLGALVISMVLELILKKTAARTGGDDSYRAIRRAFGEEKASSVRDTIAAYVRRHRSYMSDDLRLLDELRSYEAKLSDHLTALRNSLVQDGQMSSRGFKIWVNGASVHVQMLIHEARLQRKHGRLPPRRVNAIGIFIDQYVEDLGHVIEKYKLFKTETSKILRKPFCVAMGACADICYMRNTEEKCDPAQKVSVNTCGSATALMEAYVDKVIANHQPISTMKRHFSDTRNDLSVLIGQSHTFTLPVTIWQ